VTFHENIRRLVKDLPKHSFVYDMRLSKKDALIHLKKRAMSVPGT
jgi:hypothetical protein